MDEPQTDPPIDSQDILEKDEELKQRIIAIPRDKIFAKRNVLAILSILAIGLISVVLVGLRATDETRDAVKSENAALVRENQRLEDEVTAYEDVLTQATDAIIQLSEQVVALGGEPPEIILRPTTTTTEP